MPTFPFSCAPMPPILLFSHPPILPSSYSPILLFSHPPILPSSYSPILLFSHSPILLFSHSLLLPFSHYPILPFSLTPILLWKRVTRFKELTPLWIKTSEQKPHKHYCAPLFRSPHFPAEVSPFPFFPDNFPHPYSFPFASFVPPPFLHDSSIPNNITRHPVHSAVPFIPSHHAPSHVILCANHVPSPSSCVPLLCPQSHPICSQPSQPSSTVAIVPSGDHLSSLPPTCRDGKEVLVVVEEGPRMHSHNPAEGPRMHSHNPAEGPRMHSHNPAEGPRMHSHNPAEGPRMHSHNPAEGPHTHSCMVALR
ncbi:unnamed protein product [Closterium sp. Naga37s-1]|nr:unnamed protein product [Closterium sp. Naga37s-1]